jgi:hypothetical protein
MIELTLEQQKALVRDCANPPRVVDPSTHDKYVLIREEMYERVRQRFEEDDASQFVRAMTPHVMNVFGRDGWDDPAMDVYNDLDPRLNP